MEARHACSGSRCAKRRHPAKAARAAPLQSWHAVPLAWRRAAMPRRPSTGHLEELGYRSRRRGVQALLLQVCGPRSQVFRECRICIRVPVIQVAAVLPVGRVGSERVPQRDRDRSAQLAFIRICCQCGDDSRKPVGKLIAAQPRISCRDSLGVRLVIGRESGCVKDGVRWLCFQSSARRCRTNREASSQRLSSNHRCLCRL